MAEIKTKEEILKEWYLKDPELDEEMFNHWRDSRTYTLFISAMDEYASQFNKWFSVSEEPELGKRILCFSPVYKEDDPMRFRIIDSQFLKISKDVTKWQYLNPPTK